MSHTTASIASSGQSVEHRSPPARSYFPALDGLRAISFLGVFAWHYLGLPYGWAGVDVFFVLSGFLITGILFDTQDDPHRFRNFYIRRTLRIFPLYYAVLLGIFLVTPVFRWNWTWQWIAWPLYLGNFLRFLYPHLNNNFIRAFADASLVSTSHPLVSLHLGHFWTLCVEEQFYLLWPWIVFTVRDRRKLMAICVACILVVPVARSYAMAHLPIALVRGEVVLHSTPFRFDTLLLGALIALLYRGSHRRQMQRVAQVTLTLSSVGAMWVAAYWFRFQDSTVNRAVADHPWMLTLVALSAGSLMLRTLVPGTVPYRMFNVRWLRSIGTVSYGAYVFHDIFHSQYSRFLSHRLTSPVSVVLLTAALGLVTTLAMAFLSYYFFEYPILRLKGSFYAQAHPRTLFGKPTSESPRKQVEREPWRG